MTEPIKVSPERQRPVAARLDALLHDAGTARSASSTGCRA